MNDFAVDGEVPEASCRKNLTRLATAILYPGCDHREPVRNQNVAGTSTGGGRAAVKLWPGGDQRVVSAVVTQYRFSESLRPYILPMPVILDLDVESSDGTVVPRKGRMSSYRGSGIFVLGFDHGCPRGATRSPRTGHGLAMLWRRAGHQMATGVTTESPPMLTDFVVLVTQPR